MVAIVRVTGSGQITIPADLRRKHHIARGDRVMVTENAEGHLVVRPIAVTVDDLLGRFPLLPGVETDGDFDDLIDEAFEEGYAWEHAEARDGRMG